MIKGKKINYYNFLKVSTMLLASASFCSLENQLILKIYFNNLKKNDKSLK